MQIFPNLEVNCTRDNSINYQIKNHLLDFFIKVVQNDLNLDDNLNYVLWYGTCLSSYSFDLTDLELIL